MKIRFFTTKLRTNTDNMTACYNTVLENQSTMMQMKQKCNEAPHCNVLDFLKRLLHKDDLLQWHHSENQHLKTLIQQNTMGCNTHENVDQSRDCMQHAIKDGQGNAYVRYNECKVLEESLQKKCPRSKGLEKK